MEFVEHLKHVRQEEQNYLAHLEGGARVGRRPAFGGPHSWQDQTKTEIQKSKKIIAELDTLIVQHEGS